MFFFSFLFRAQSDANFRKEKLRSLKLDDGSRTAKPPMSESRESLPAPTQQEKSAQVQAERLLKELDSLKESNKDLTEKLQVSLPLQSRFPVQPARIQKLQNEN